ncbi:hypothetical protein BO94DRAFT_527186 [Aspergillus sclerotioniger CBS 115572]|uniref:Uncharacterized protein n=1 Tax=Aspergillus sclerotioniger CBS 115572 TaxID=1450535 RepID=A0A317V6E0_9EURO|nr:hypothetical protein BO94DRAFT_527186 [Aspergillus sclerotioniger CBS 115572]PWY69626.1 hypothetical protein BO94DRAFT_527186 [Aspergillus sclerotioniger CBS 115572]
MSNTKLFPGDPSDVMVIRQVTEDITTFSVPFSRFGLLKFGGRGTLIRLTTSNLAIFSPVALTPAIHHLITTTGTGKVSYIIAPDLEHHIYLSTWKTAFPDAKILAPEGLYEKRRADPTAYPDATPFEFIFTKENKHTLHISDEFHADFEIEYVDGHTNREIVLLDKRSGTLIEADLLFNLPATEQYSRLREGAGDGVANRLFMPLVKLGGGEGGWQAWFMWWVLSKGDRESFGDSVRRIAEWEFERVVPCHGDVVEGKGKEVFRGVFGRFWG